VNVCVFDLDGTLGHLRGGEAEDGNFVAAIHETLGAIEVDSNWDAYAHVSDYGVVDELFRRHRDRPPTRDEHQAVCSAYLRRVRAAVERGETRFELINGSAEAVRNLRAEHGWEVALATGGWRRTALYKLELGGIDMNGRAQAFAEDGPSRATIMQTALNRSRSANGRAFARVVYVGDAAWDVRTCTHLAWPFVGIGDGERGERLRKLGASHVLPDMSDLAAFVTALDEARVPTPA